MVKTRHSRDQTDQVANDEASRLRTTSKNDLQLDHRANGFQSDSSHEDQFISRKRRRPYQDDSEDSVNSIRNRAYRVRRLHSVTMGRSSRRYFENPKHKLGIRRSTRRKKSMYQSYDQNHIERQLSLVEQGYEDDEASDIDVVVGQRRGRNYISQEEEDESSGDNEERINKMKNHKEEEEETQDSTNRDSVRMHRKGTKRLKEDVEEDDTEETIKPKRSYKRMEVDPILEEENVDMYTRVKRERRQIKRDMYGIPIDNNKDDKSSTDLETEEEEEHSEESEDERRETVKATNKSYNLRLHCRKTNLYAAPPIEPQRSYRKSLRNHGSPYQSLNSSKDDYRSPIKKRRKRAAFHSSTSCSSGSDDEQQFERRKLKSMAKARQRCLPMNFTNDDMATSSIRDRAHTGSSLADVEPMAIDRSVLFDSVGGLGKQIQALKEMIVFPLLYAEVFTKFRISPPRGVLFHGPPGTGKTLVARALANECSQGDTKVAFFMRKGADCLSKWVGESERQLRLLFDQAYQMRPAIIFFDEIDGLAPVRSSRQDQIHSSIVSTLLALMDGLDSRGEVVVIGATNRVDAIDPALRRPGRFDREFLFPLPSLEDRKQILHIHTKEWNPQLADSFVAELARKCVGYCGADLKALCTEAALLALRRRYPQIYNSRDKLLIDVSSIHIRSSDFYRAMDRILPTAQRSATSPAKALNFIILPLLQSLLTQAISAIQTMFPSAFSTGSSLSISGNCLVDDEYSDDDAGCDVSHDNAGDNRTSQLRHFPPTFRPRLLLAGESGQGQSCHLGPAVLHRLENLSVHVMDLPAILAVGTRTPEEACTQVVREARRNSPSILYLPHINELWDVIGDAVRATLLTLLQDLEPSVPVLLLATCETQYHDLPLQVKELFCHVSKEVISVREPDEAQRKEFFEDLILRQTSQPPPPRKRTEKTLEVLPKAPKPEPRKLTTAEQKRLYEQEETTLRELRLFLRDIINKLGKDRKFIVFKEPVDKEEVPDYYDIVKNPMDLSTMMTKIDQHKYESVQQFLQDIDLIRNNALEYNPDRDIQGRTIRHRACSLMDTTRSIIHAELDTDFGVLCDEIAQSRQNRGYVAEDGALPSCCFTKQQEPSTSAAAESETLTRRRTRSQASIDTKNETVSISPAGSQNMHGKDDEYPRKVIKKIRFCRTRKKTGFKSPWCRTKKPIYRKVTIYVDRDGKEIPAGQLKQVSGDSSVSQTGKAQADLAGAKKDKLLKHPKVGGSDILKTGSMNSDCNSDSAKCQGKPKSSVKTADDVSRQPVAAAETSNLSPLPLIKSLSGCQLDSSSDAKESHSLVQIPPNGKGLTSPTDNGRLDSSVHDLQTKKAVQTLAKALKTVVIDNLRLRTLLGNIVQKTQGYHVEHLEKLYSQLSLCIYSRRNDYDKTQLLQDLENCVEQILPVDLLKLKPALSTSTTQDLLF